MHEEYRPGYNWEDMIEKEFKKSIPWGDFDESSEEPDTTFDCEEPDPWILHNYGQRLILKTPAYSNLSWNPHRVKPSYPQVDWNCYFL